MEITNINNIPVDQPIELRNFLKRREFYSDLTTTARMTLTFLDQMELTPENTSYKIAALKLFGLLSIRPSLEDIREHCGLLREAVNFCNINISAQNIAKLTSRFLTILIALTTFSSGVAALRDSSSFVLPFIFTGVKKTVSDALLLTTYCHHRYLAAQLQGKSDKEILQWIREQVGLMPHEENQLLQKANKKVNPTEEVRSLKASLINQKKQWLREVMGDEALKIALSQIEENAEPKAVEYIKNQIKLKKAANLCALVKSIVTLAALICLHRGGNVKKYSALLHAIAGMISLPDSILHRKVAQYQ